MSRKKTDAVEMVPFNHKEFDFYMRERKEAMLVEDLQAELGMNDGEWASVQEAARDAHLDVRSYCRLMVLCAAGLGGVTEHAERAIAASFDVDKAPGIKVTVKSRNRR